MIPRAALLGALLAAAVSAQSPDPLRLVEYGADLSVRDRLIEAGAFFGDLGRAGLARPDSATAADLAARGIAADIVPALRAGESIVVTARTRSGAGAIHGRLLLARRAYFVSAAQSTDIPMECRGSGFHGGIQVIDVDEPYAVAPELPARPQALVQDPLIAGMVGQVQASALQAHVQALSGLFTRRATSADNAQAIQYVTGQLATVPNITFRTESFSGSYGPNVIAELPGTDLASEIVMVGAHIDSIVGGSSTARSPGADDNASGSAAVLELVRIMANQQFRRTIRFAWWNAEEFGLVGSNAYAAAAAARGDAIVAYVNTDMNAYRAAGDALSLDFVTNDSTASLIDALTASAQTYVPGLTINRGSLTGGTSDHRSFFRNGFAAAFPFEDIGQYSPFIHTSNDALGSSANDFQLSELITRSVLAGLADLAEIGFANPGTFTRFGQACVGTGTTPNTCASNNENGGSLANLLRTNEYAYRVPSQGALQVEAFEVFSASTTGGPVTVGAYVYADAGGLPAAAPLAQTTVTIAGTPGFYRATLPSPVTVQGAFHLAVDHSAQTTYLATLGAGQSGSGSWRRPALTGSWAASGIISAPSFRVICAGGGTRTSPSMGNDGVPIVGRSFALTLSQAAPGAVTALLIGTSDQSFGGISLPAPLPGAPGCSLLVAPERIDQRAADGAGSARVDLPVPGDPALIGVDVFHQWVVIDAGANALGLAVSEGARTRIGG
ncbi:MAG: M20/M25/M40 family metallo-hydrolase [Planctomycetota bacterium]|nr:M20/M25/M40 family metallo-hydrolase [Planctomycetota bacterium]MDA0932527.1 M20/M25/M40 family metallo-hydrolase [Planctomycetota bacterium]MDA1221337.1 M20/M25/M40 family metallo-hydrolase [Planctomycetota bacterium]